MTGVDNDGHMLDRARARAAAEIAGSGGSLELVEADLVGLALPEGAAFDFGLLALNSLMALGTRTAQQAAIQALADHLVPGGIAAVDVWLPDADDLARYDGRQILEWPRPEPITGAIVTKTGSAQHDAATGTIALTTIFEEGAQGAAALRWVRRDRLRLCRPTSSPGSPRRPACASRRSPAATTSSRTDPVASVPSSSRFDVAVRPPSIRARPGRSAGRVSKGIWYRRRDGFQ